MVTSNGKRDARLARLQDAERKAQERLERLVGYPDDVRKAAYTLWREASEAVRAHCECRRNNRN